MHCVQKMLGDLTFPGPGEQTRKVPCTPIPSSSRMKRKDRTAKPLSNQVTLPLFDTNDPKKLTLRLQASTGRGEQRTTEGDCEALYEYLSDAHREHARRTVVPAIEVTPSRRVSISSPLRFTRTFSQDSLEALERTCRKELRRKLLDLPEKQDSTAMSLLPSPVSRSPCTSLGDLGQSPSTTKEPSSTSSNGSPSTPGCPFNLQRPSTVVLKRSFGDVNEPLSPTRKTLVEIVGLTPYQQKLLTQCWPNMYSTGAGGQFASSIYHNLARKSPKAKQLLAKANGVAVFSNSDLDCTAMHARVTLELLDTAIRNLDAEHTKLTAYLIETFRSHKVSLLEIYHSCLPFPNSNFSWASMLASTSFKLSLEVGRSHRPLRQEGLSTSMWDDLGDCLIDCVRRYDIVRKHKELRRAWLALIAYIVDNMKQGQSIFRSASSYELVEGGGSPGGTQKK